MKTNFRLLTVGVGALAAGVVNGLLGAGGGILLVFALSSALGGLYEKGDELYKRRDLMAISMCVMLPVSCVSAIRYGMSGMLDTQYIQKIILPTVIGGILGGVLLDRLKESVIMKLFAFLVIYSGLAMIVR